MLRYRDLLCELQHVLSVAGMTWVFSSKVVQFVETTWLEQLQAFS